jgi:5'-nucleotidase
MLCCTASAADMSHLVIIHTNDTHGYVQRAEGINGLATVAALKKDYEAKGYNVLLLDAGDAIQDNNLVNLSKGKTAIDFMNHSHYDAMTLGNHEFDYGQEELLKRVHEAKFPVISANINVEATRRPFIPPNTILNKGDVKVGIFGLTTPQSKVSSTPKNTYGLQFLANKNLYTCAQSQIDSLRAKGCDLVICLAHLGSEDTLKGNRSEDVLANVNNLDICIDGHDHTVKNKHINGALLTETGYYTHNIGIIKHTEKGWESSMLPYGYYNKEDPEVKAVVDKAAANVKKQLAKKIGSTTFFLDGNRDPGVRTKETNLGDFCTDAILWQARQANVLSGPVDGAFINGGGIRRSIPIGSITAGSLHEVFPYNNQLCIMQVSGQKLLEAFEAATSNIPPASPALPQVAGINYSVNTVVPYTKGKQYGASTYFAAAKPGSRVTIKSIGGKPFDPKALYTIATIEFIASGGDAYGALAEPGAVTQHNIGYLDNEALENYIRTELHGTIPTIYATSQKRITIY